MLLALNKLIISLFISKFRIHVCQLHATSRYTGYKPKLCYMLLQSTDWVNANKKWCLVCYSVNFYNVAVDFSYKSLQEKLNCHILMILWSYFINNLHKK